MRVGWCKSQSNIWYWWDGKRLWCPNACSSGVVWMEPCCLDRSAVDMVVWVQPSSALEGLLTTGEYLRPPRSNDLFTSKEDRLRFERGIDDIRETRQAKVYESVTMAGRARGMEDLPCHG